MTRTQVPVRSIVSNTSSFSRVRGLNEDNLDRHGGLKISQDSDSFRIIPFGDRLFPPWRPWDTTIPVSKNTLFGYTKACRKVWQQTLVDYEEVRGVFGKKVLPFQAEWDFQARPDLLKRLAPDLAVAGNKLFFLIFENHQDEVLQEIAALLRQKSIEMELVVTITSDSFFVPWGLIYTHPDPNEELASDGSNFNWEGFWGYRHIIEHNTKWIELQQVISSDSLGLLTSVNIDENIDTQLNVDSIKLQRAFFDELHTLKVIRKEERTKKDQLRKAFENEDFSDRILYFYCHGVGADGAAGPNLEDASIQLTDRQPITGSDIALWLKKNQEFISNPLVFINACQGGQMTTMFYETLAAEFLKRKAVGLIGCQIDIPALFAAEYAKRILSEFINSPKPGDQKIRLGPLMRTVTRELIDRHQNPLGLVYSLYRGADCYIDRRGRVPSAVV